MVLNRLLASILCLGLLNGIFAQKGKDAAKTVSVTNVKVNEFTALTSPAAINDRTLTVAASALNTNTRFTSTLTPGDLVMVIQMQGALMNLGTYPTAWIPDSTYGKVYDYAAAGNYEFAEVKSIISGTQIELTCGLKYAYSSSGKTQVVRIPRYSSLTVTSAGTLTTDAWNGTIGGVLAVEVDGNTTINGVISASGLGFRGGIAIGNGGSGNSNFVTKNPNDGAEKGEGIGSDRLNNALGIDSLGKQCKGAPANGGGGGDANNSAGGGGGNGGNILNYKGLGISNQTFSVNFNLEYPSRSSITSSGGGKGGYGTSTTNTVNANTVGPNSTLWGSFKRPWHGGFGGRPLDYSTGKLFMGGGGGAGHMSVGQSNGANACSGGAGGGLIYILNYGTISGTGSVSSDGANGNNAFGTANFTNPTQGIDGAGGAGAGGTIILQSSGAISSIIANANGGNGGNQLKSGTTNSEGQGPGGGGGGGYIASTNIGFTQNVNGGANGTTNATAFDTEFPMNGATSGDVGTNNQVITPSFSLSASPNQTICTNQSTNLTATSTNTTSTIQWYNSLSGNAISSGTVYTTPTYTATGTYTVYAGSCPGIYRVPILINVITGPTFSINSPTICQGQTTILTVTTSATSYTWNTTGSPTTSTLSVSPSSTTIYTINGSSSSCVGTKTTQVTVNNLPTVTVPNATICAGTSTVLTASGSATSFTWMPGSITTSTISANSNTTYTITGSNGTCTNSAISTVTVIALPVVSVPNATICSGTSTVLTASGTATSFTWMPGSITTSTISANSNTIYTITGSNGTCTNSTTASVTVVALPTISVPSATICSGTSTVLTASGTSTSFTWMPGSITTSTISSNSNTTYTITGSNGACTNSTTATVTVVALPAVSVPSATICAGTSTVLTASGTATSFTWMPGNITTSTISANSNATYTITGSNGTCSNSTTANVTITPTPTLTANSATICAGQVATFTVSGATSYTWNPGGITGTTFTISPASSGTVSVTGMNGNCSSQITRSVTVTPNPTVAVSNQTICPTQTITLTASGTTTYSWNTGPTTNTISVSPSSTTIYTVTGTSALCSNTQTVSVTVSSQPTVAVANTSICSGNSTTLTASGATNYTWMPGGQLTSTVSVNPGSNTIYTITGSNGACTNSTTASVSVTPTPTLTANSATICAGQVATFTVSGATSYTWNPGGITGTTFTISPASSGTVAVIGANGSCSSQITRSVTVSPSPTIAISNQTICPSQTVTLTASGATTYTWSTGPNTNTISVSPASQTVYTVSGSLGSCSSSKTVTVSIAATPTLAVANATLCSGSSTTLTASGATSYTWLPGSQTTTSISVNPTSTAAYTVTGSNGICTNSAVATVSVTNTPTLTANSATICPGQTATLTVSGAASYTWTPGNTSGTSYTISPSSNTTVSVTGANGSCTASATVSVTIGSGISISVNNPTICAGQTVSLTAGGATSYTWDTGANTNTLNVSPALTTTYTILGTSGACSGSNTAVVTVVSVPSVTVANASICSGSTATLSASGATNYTWMPSGQTTSGITDNPSTTTIYTITGSNGICSNTTTATVSVTATPTLMVNSTTICPSQTATLIVSGATSYNWNPGGVIGNTYTISPAGNTVVTVDGANGTCTSQTTASVTIGTGISITVNSPTICAGQTANLTASGAASYTWDTGANTNTLNVTPASTQIYTVSGVSGSCSGINTATVSVINQPTLSVTNASICAGNSTTLTVSGALNYTWSPGGATTSSISVNPSSTSIYTITGSDGTCSASTTATVNVTSTPNLTANSVTTCAGQTATLTVSGAISYTWNPGSIAGSTYTINPLTNTFVTVVGANGSCTAQATPSVIIGTGISISVNSPTICAGQTASLTANGATSYTWDTGANTNTLNVSPVSITVYTITGSNGSCNGFNTATVTVNSAPTLSVTSSNICSGQSATLNATGANTYTWSSGSNSNPLIVSPGTTAFYTVSGTNSSGCINTSLTTTSVNVTATPTISVNSPTICAGQSATLTAIGAGSFSWTTFETTPSINTSPVNTTTYSVLGSNGICSSSSTSTVTVSQSPTLTVNALNTLGCAPLCTNFLDITSASCSTILYNYGDGTTGNTNNPVHCFANSGNYTVTATCTNTLGCSSTYTVPGTIQVNLTPSADFTIQEGIMVVVGTTVHFNNTSANAIIYNWNLCDGSTSSSQNINMTYQDTGNCCVTLLASNSSCTNSATKCITIVREATITIPNVFTPNGDGSNELFKITSTGIKSLNCSIYDRWGLKMYEWDGLNGYWDGNAKNGGAPSGTYFYIINYTDQLGTSTTEKGFLNLFRD
ncbi:MAG: gliding motility-associated C-terminal domain-containing protein [Burkholderiales bacterium]|nr:gliding motility-associated C-terminal domain-containing protein [Bacteroidia bacterium]